MYSATLERIEGGKPGLRTKIRRVRQLVEKAKRDPNFRAEVVALIRDVPEKDHTGEIETLVEFARQGIRYVRDPWSPTGLELFIDPRTMLRDVHRGTAQGDCDDHVLLASALLEVAGYATRYKVGGMAPGAYRHIWLDVSHPKRGWLPIEMTKKDWPIGRDPSGKFPVVETHLGDGDTMGGLGATSDSILPAWYVKSQARRQRPRLGLETEGFRRLRRDFVHGKRRDVIADTAAQRKAHLDLVRAGGGDLRERQRRKAQLRMLRTGKSAGARAARERGTSAADFLKRQPEIQARAMREQGGFTSGRDPWQRKQLRARQAHKFRKVYGRGPMRSRRFGTRGVFSVSGLGEVPRSFHNVVEDAPLYAGATPSDFFRATEVRDMAPEHSPLRYASLLGWDDRPGLEDILEDWDLANDDEGYETVELWQQDALGGFFKKVLRAPKKLVRKVKKAARKVEKTVKKTGRKVEKTVSRPVKQVGQEATRALHRSGRELKKGVQQYGPEAVGIVGTVLAGPAVGAALYGATAAMRQQYLDAKAMAAGDYAPEIYYEPIPIEAEPPIPTPTAPGLRMQAPHWMQPVANGFDVSSMVPSQPTTQARALPRGPSLPVSMMSSYSGPSFVQAAEGYALPPGVPDQVAVEDQGAGAYWDEQGWDAPLPGAGAGSYILPAPLWEFPNAPPIDPFDTPADGVDGGDYFPGFGMGYGTAPWTSVESQFDAAGTFGDYDDMENSALDIGFGTLGAESWITQLAKAAGSTVIEYQKARLAAKGKTAPAWQTGLMTGLAPFLAPPPAPEPAAPPPPPPPAPPPPPLAAAVAPVRPARIITVQAPPPPPPVQVATRGGFQITPAIAMAGAALVALLAMRR